MIGEPGIAGFAIPSAYHTPRSEIAIPRVSSSATQLLLSPSSGSIPSPPAVSGGF